MKALNHGAYLFILEHKIFVVPPFLGLMSMFLNFSPVHGALLLQYMPAATLYLEVP
jgi:hypothetical protein